MRLFLMAVLATVGFTVSAEAASQAYVRIDCHHSSLSGTETRNQLTVEFMNGSTVVASVNQSISSASDLLQLGGENFGKFIKYDYPYCGAVSDAMYVANADPTKVTSVRITTNGTDAFFIDTLEFGGITEQVSASGGTKLLTTIHSDTVDFGVENGGGYCLSLNPSDPMAEWQGQVSECYKTIQFNTKTGTVGGTLPPDTGRPAPFTTWVDKDSLILRLLCVPLADNPETKDLLVFTAEMADGSTAGYTKSAVGSRCFPGPVPIVLDRNLSGFDSFVVSTAGDDAFFFMVVTATFQQWDPVRNEFFPQSMSWTGNGKGWCLSTDASDANAWADKLVDACATAWRFKVDGTVEPASQVLYSHSLIVDVDCEHSDLDGSIAAVAGPRIIGSVNNRQYKTISSQVNNRKLDCESGIFAGNMGFESARFTFDDVVGAHSVGIENTSNEAFYVDQVTVHEWYYDADGKFGKHVVNQAGVDNGSGWCLSTDKKDNGGDWAAVTSGDCIRKLFVRLYSPGTFFLVE